jgi:outer membrane protein assembly factor BamB
LVSDELAQPLVSPPRLPSPLFIGSNGFVAALDTSTGQELWRTQLQRGAFKATGSADVSVLVRGALIFAGAAGHLFCLAADTGQIIWHNELSGMGYNDISLAIDNVSIQYLQKVVRHTHNLNTPAS